MAITIDNTPASYQSIHEDLWFVVSSSNTTQSNFKYVFDVKINTTLVARVKVFPELEDGKGLFNASSIIRNYVENAFRPNPTSTLFTFVSNIIRVQYKIEYGEEYGGTTYTNLTNGTYNAYNYYPNILDGYGSFDGSWYDNYKAMLLTKRDDQNIITRRTNGRCFVSLLNGDENNSNNWRFDVTRWNSGTPTTNTSGGNIALTDFALLDVSPAAVNAYLGTTFITDATDFYGLNAYQDGADQWQMVVKILCEPKFEAIPIHFLNQLGGYDTYNFSLVNREQRAMDRKSYDEVQWQYASDQMNRANSYRVYYGGYKPFVTEQTITYTLTSDWLSLKDYTWLKDLIASPDVYMENNGYYIPVKVNTNTWQEKKRYADKTYNITLEVELGKAYSQFR
jgi:hypothetical protein